MGDFITAAVALWSAAVTVYELGKRLWELYDKNVAKVLETIHYQELKKIHDIAFIVSESYRELWRGIYDEMSELSVAIGMEANAISTVFRNARSLVLNTTATFGHPYDVAEIEWLAAMDSYLWIFNVRVKYYGEHPEWLFQDIDKHLNRKILDKHANFSATILSNITRALFLGNEGIRRADSLSDDLTLFTNSLPNVIKNKIKPFIDSIDNKIDKFIEETYEPVFGNMNQAIIDLEKSRALAKLAAEALTNRLKNPGRFLKEIDGLSELDRRMAEIAIGEIASRELKRETEILTEYIAPEFTEMERIANLEIEGAKEEEWFVGEIEGSVMTELGKIGKGSTWFVGDY